ncbi:MAG: trimethylamine methyltransferase family protein [Myxococcota bacterium]|nr:trimethylamine methyltransferase family protein [Myxococcota bacterium]
MSEEEKASKRPRRTRRAGGRDARRAARAADTGGKVVRPGFSGGQYKPLSQADIQRIHGAALDVLENIGIGDAIPEILDAVLPKGCILGEDGRLRFPRGLVEDAIAKAPKSYVLHAPDPDLDMEVREQEVILTTSGEPVKILDYETQKFRDPHLIDIYDAARLVDRMEHIHYFGQPFVATDWSHDLYVHDMNTAYAALAGTRKTFSLGVATVGHIDPLISLFDLYLGKEGAFLERPFCCFGGCPIVSPLRFAEENAEVLVKLAKLGLVVDVAIAAQAGATAPASLAGALVQTFAETLACLTVVHLINPDCPMNFGMWPFISDLRTGAFSGGSGEEALITAATVQIINHYGLISSVPSGMTDAKTMDAQAGYEKAITTLSAVLAGGNMVATYPGAVGSLMGQSMEGILIDNDMMGTCLRVLRGIEVTEERLSLKEIESAVFGDGHFLNQPQTLEIMRTEYLYPEVGDRSSVGDWEESGSPTVYDRAHDRVKEILASHYPEYIDPKVDAAIRNGFPIQILPGDMKPGNGRWD